MDTSLFDSLFLFEGTDFSQIDEKYSVVSSLRSSSYDDGEKIICDGLPVIASGNAAIISGEGEHITVLRKLAAGDTFGAATLFFRGEHRTSVISVGKCSILYIPREMLLTLMKYESAISVNYVSFLSERIAFLNRKITAFTAGSADARLSIYLLGLHERNGVATIPVSLSQLSNMLGVGRASLYRSFDAMEEQGIIKRDGKIITILDREKLDNYTK